ncbi:hypothetical protein [Mycobacterium sp.]|uniref:hypothetical protein n=1 Tax=Mycobacterium sp. TaxID=1785 RepID=UPI002614238D|nr:hypothetical protein [Mycobacterium sp.]
MGYPTAAELVAASAVPELTGAAEPDQEALRTAAIVAVETYCGQSFDTEVATYTVDGSGDGVLYLPRRLATLTALSVNDEPWAVGDVVVSDDRTRLLFSLTGGSAYSRMMLAVQGIDQERVWPSRRGAIALTGTWGWDEVPDAVSAALRIDMEDTARADVNDLSSTVAASRKLGLTGIRQGNLSLSIGEVGGLSPRAIRLLSNDLIWRGPIGGLA